VDTEIAPVAVDASIASIQAGAAYELAKTALPLVGGVKMTGLYELFNAPQTAMNPANKLYVDLLNQALTTAVLNAQETADQALAQAYSGPVIAVGTWNATTNSPVVLSSDGAAVGGEVGHGLVISVAGTTSINGNATWEIGDTIVWNGSIWYRLPFGGLFALASGGVLTDAVISGPSGRFTAGELGNLQFDVVVDGLGNISFRDVFGFEAMQLASNGQLLVQNLQINSTGETMLGNLIIISRADGDAFVSFTDEFGFEAMRVAADGKVQAGTLTADMTEVAGPASAEAVIGDTLNLQNGWRVFDAPDGFGHTYFADEFGFIAFGIEQNGDLLGVINEGGGGGEEGDGLYSSIELEARDAQAMGRSYAVVFGFNPSLAQLSYVLNGFVTYGQSYAMGAGGAPRLSTNEVTDNICLGTIPANVDLFSPIFEVSGSNAFYPLTGPDGLEIPGISATNYLRQLTLAQWSLERDLTRRVVMNGCGTGGRSIEELSKGATPDIYLSIFDLFSKQKALADASAASMGVFAMGFLQGQANYVNNEFTHTTAGYLALFEQLVADFTEDTLAAFPLQTKLPAIYTTQTSSDWDATGDTCQIGMAQLIAAEQMPQVFLVGPEYHVPDFNKHPNNNGYRMLGSKMGQVMYQVQVLRQGWRPCSPAGAFFRGANVLLELHTPVPPLQVQAVYDLAQSPAPIIFSNYGFKLQDDDGPIGIVQVTLRNSSIHFVTSRATTTEKNPYIQYAGREIYEGQGNICDSDPSVTLDVSSVDGLPYPMWNWLCAFLIPIVTDPLTTA